MKLRVYLCLLLTFIATTLARAQHGPLIVDVVFDLDWTLIYKLPDDFVDPGSEEFKVLKVGDEKYKVNTEALRALSVLHETPGIRVSYFSGGKPARNYRAIASIYLEIYKMTGTLHSQRSIASFYALTDKPHRPDAKFTEKYRKDLKSVGSFINLEQAVLVDDLQEFSLEGQQRNLLWTRDEYPVWIDKGVNWELKVEKKKWAWVLGTILKAKEFSETRGVSFVEAMQRLTHDSSGKFITHADEDAIKLIDEGIKSLQFHFGGHRCNDAFTPPPHSP